ncbi:hypothetical protein HL42_3687 [Trichophyton rubrum]|nr:hypothetical protein HL42_3687 [Trichophyton rubrum]
MVGVTYPIIAESSKEAVYLCLACGFGRISLELPGTPVESASRPCRPAGHDAVSSLPVGPSKQLGWMKGPPAAGTSPQGRPWPGGAHCPG